MASSILPPLKNQLPHSDIIFRQMLVFSKMFTKSWGPPKVLRTLRHYQHKYAFQGNVMELIEQNMPEMVIEKNEITKEYQIQEGCFHSPLEKLSPLLFKSGQNNAKAVWRGFFPPPGRSRNGLVIHLAPTGDQTYYRRYHLLVKPLLAMGISSILLQNPFYAERKPEGQKLSALHNVSDLFVMGGALICESCFLVRWAREQGYSHIGISGLSMGGYMASLAATNVRDQPVALIPLLSWTSAAPVFTQGAMANSISWPVLAKELTENNELRLLLNESGWADMMEDKNHQAYRLFPNLPAKRLMWILMEEFTNLSNYPAPIANEKVHFVLAERDRYVIRSDQIPDIKKLWPGSQVTEFPRWGHVGAYFLATQLFLEKIIETLGVDVDSTMVPEKPATSNAFTWNLNIQWQQPWEFMRERIGVKNNASLKSSPIFEVAKQNEINRQESNV